MPPTWPLHASKCLQPANLHACACQARERDWCNVVTAHEGDSAAYTWRLQHYTLGEHVLHRPPSKDPDSDEGKPAPVTAVAMSHCGNFALVGSATGQLDRYNVQSGLHRGSYCRCAAHSRYESVTFRNEALAMQVGPWHTSPLIMLGSAEQGKLQFRRLTD